MTKRNNNQRPQNTTRKQARADMFDMLNAFMATPDIHAMSFANEVGELNVQRDMPFKTELRRMGFDTANAVSTTELEQPDDEYATMYSKRKNSNNARNGKAVD